MKKMRVLLVDDEQEFVETMADRLKMRDEVLRRVKKAYPKVEVIILTGHGTEKDEEVARSLGAFDYVTKPIDLDNLVPRIKDAFKARMKKLQDMSMAVAFAEAGEFDTAKKIMEDDGDKKK
jgi:DNA-binding response OmpR family regulator